MRVCWVGVLNLEGRDQGVNLQIEHLAAEKITKAKYGFYNIGFKYNENRLM